MGIHDGSTSIISYHFLGYLFFNFGLLNLFNYPVEPDIFHDLMEFSFHCSRLLGLTDGFNDEIKTLALDDDTNEQTTISNGGSAMGKLKKRKVHHSVFYEIFCGALYLIRQSIVSAG
jgi:hypothetical protein